MHYLYGVTTIYNFIARMFKAGILFINTIASLLYIATAEGEAPKTTLTQLAVVNTVTHNDWNTLLQKHVDAEGNVDYKGFQNDKQALKTYLDDLAQNEPAPSWTKEERLAYYINLYNAGTVLLILDHYPTKSIKDISNPWGEDRVFIGEKKYSLGDIEHKILRKMDEPRIHFAINCASYSCPKLWNKAFTAPNLESQLDIVTKDFITDSKRNRITENKVELSNIFKWYKKDFTENGALIDYINTYSKTKIGTDAKISYLKYDWSLNERK